MSSAWKNLSDEKLARAIELLVLPEWLNERRTMIAILESQDFRPVDAIHQLRENESLNEGPTLSWSF